MVVGVGVLAALSFCSGDNPVQGTHKSPFDPVIAGYVAQILDEDESWASHRLDLDHLKFAMFEESDESLLCISEIVIWRTMVWIEKGCRE